MTQSEALAILKTGANVFLTGEPGAGKTYTVQNYINYLEDCGIEPSVTASTGIAATHIGGMTIHSWSGIGIRSYLSAYDLDTIASNERVSKRINRTKVLIIDEVSMLSSTMLSMVDAVCKTVRQSSDPFGGIQVVLVGDFFQLPPISRREESMHDEDEQPKQIFAFHSPAWKNAHIVVCYITEQHRQSDREFLSLLSAIRSDSVIEDHLEILSDRTITHDGIPDGITKLFSHNADVDRINNEEIARIDEEVHTFDMESQGPEKLVLGLKKGCLSPERLVLKIGASVMCTKNNPIEGYANGTLGTVIGFDSDEGNPIIETRDGREIVVAPAEWVLEDDGKIRARIIQIPLRLAWAITVHKSQGMSLDAAAMDLSGVFEFGQGYVALSRVRSLSGLYLLGINDRVFRVHPEVLDRDAMFREESEKAAETFGTVDPSELSKMHENFIRALGGELPKAGAPRPKKKTGASIKGSTQEETFLLWREGKTLSQIAEARGLKESTICSHVGDLVAAGKISRGDVYRILTPELTSALPEIHAAFRELGDEKLAPVFARFSGVYSYDDLRKAKMLFEK